MKLKNKVAIVTGAGAGIGRRIAEVFAEEGAIIVAASRRSESGQPVAEAIVRSGASMSWLTMRG